MIGGFAIGNSDKALDPPGFRVADREELLVLTHRGLQHFRRQAQKRLADLAHQHHGPFDQPGHLGQKPGIRHNLQPLGKGLILRVMPDCGLTLGGIEHHEGAAQLGGVIFKARDGEARGGHETVAKGGVARGQVINGDRHDFGAALI